MRVLMISDVYFPRVNGVSTLSQTFRRELAALGHQTTLIAPATALAREWRADTLALRLAQLYERTAGLRPPADAVPAAA